MRLFLVLHLLAAVTSFSVSQTRQLPASELYSDSSIATIRISLHPDFLAKMYRSDSLESDYEYLAAFAFDNGVVHDSIPDIGFRLRGNTSRYSKKKSFKVSFNTFVQGRSFHGVEKLNLNGEHNDPSIIRSKLCWDLFQAAGVEASRANHVKVFINGAFYGLYISVEHVDEDFVASRFGNNDGNLYKCLYPADLSYQGTDPNVYRAMVSDGRPVYELQTNESVHDFSDLAGFITFLKNATASGFSPEVEDRLNVPGFLRSLAVDVCVGSWDDYWFLKNNFYLYHNTATGRFEFIPYDYDNTFGIWWSGIMSGVDWGTRNIYAWGNLSEQRPLVTRLLAVPRYRNWFTYFVRKFLAQHFDPTLMGPRIDAIHALITPAAEADTFRTKDYGFSVQQFHNSYTQPLGAHVTYGLKPYIATRRTASLVQLENTHINPLILAVWHSAVGTDSIRVFARIEDDAAGWAATAYREAGGGLVDEFPLYDDGLHGDGAAGDGLVAGTVPRRNSGAPMQYSIGVMDADGSFSFDPATAPTRLHHVDSIATGNGLRINEFMAANTKTILDLDGKADDWLEITNAGTKAEALRGKFLTDNLAAPNKWRFPDTTLAPGAFLLVWADDTPAQGKLHAAFKLDKAGEEIGLFDSTAAGFVVIDSVTFGPQSSDVSMGRFPDGMGGFVFLASPSPGSPNLVTHAVEDGPVVIPSGFSLEQNYPNPFNPSTTIRFSVATQQFVRLAVYDLLGREVRLLVNRDLGLGNHSVVFDATGMSSGVYIYQLKAGVFAAARQMIVTK